MADLKVSGTPLSEEQLGDVGGGAGLNGDCGVSDNQFPKAGKCCGKDNSLAGTVYKKICSYCSIWTSLPDSTSLAVANIVECTLHGYGKRIKE